jgi:predicted nucleic acid-binding protein
MLLVLDTSVIGKWFKEETHSEIALKIREEFYQGKHEIVIPDLVLYELSNALRYDKEFNQELINAAIDSLIDMELDIVLPTEEIIKKAISLALEYDITVYDAIFLSLSQMIDAIFITADEKFYQKVKKLKYTKFLKNFK